MYPIWNEDCVLGAAARIEDETVDLIVTDPPFGIDGAKLDKHYNRKESNVLDGYVEAPDDYYGFSRAWLEQARRVMKPNASMYIVSGWTNLRQLLNACHDLGLFLINHCVWKYNFGVYTQRKYVTSHYHVLYLKKSEKAKPTFNTHCRFTGERDRTGSPLYRDMEDVWVINREYQPGEVKNKNKLPDALVEKMIAYSSNEGDVVADFFLGNFTTAFCALKMKRKPVGFELNPASFQHNMDRLLKFNPSA